MSLAGLFYSFWLSFGNYPLIVIAQLEDNKCIQCVVAPNLRHKDLCVPYIPCPFCKTVKGEHFVLSSFLKNRRTETQFSCSHNIHTENAKYI